MEKISATAYQSTSDQLNAGNDAAHPGSEFVSGPEEYRIVDFWGDNTGVSVGAVEKISRSTADAPLALESEPQRSWIERLILGFVAPENSSLNDSLLCLPGAMPASSSSVTRQGATGHFQKKHPVL